MFIDLQDLKNLKNILTRLVRSTCRNANNCAIDRIYYCNLNQDKQYYLQFLFIIVRKLQSFENVRIINKQIYLIFNIAYLVRCLFDNNKK